MAGNDSKKYYWLKLKKDFFQQHQIKVLKSLPNGRIYALIYLELLAESTSHDGELRYSQMIPYDINTLSSVIDEDRDNVEKAIQVLVSLELVEILEDKTIYMREIQKLIGSETGGAERQRQYREKLKCDNVTPVSQICHLENRDKSKEIRDKSKEVFKGIENAELVAALKDFQTMRNKIKKPLTDKAFGRLMARLEKLSNGDSNKAIAILNQSIDHCWQDIYELKPESYKHEAIDVKVDYDTPVNEEVDTSALDTFLKERKS